MRYPYEYEEVKTLRALVHQTRRRHLHSQMSTHEFAANVADIWNTATCPFLLRSEAEHRNCKRVARLCKAFIRLYSLPVRELSNGYLVAA